MANETEAVEWLNSPGYRSDAEIAGKPLHAVVNGKSACGMVRANWCMDLFNTSRCKRCEAALKNILKESQ